MNTSSVPNPPQYMLYTVAYYKILELDIYALVLMGILQQCNDAVVECLPPPFPLVNLPNHSRPTKTCNVSTLFHVINKLLLTSVQYSNSTQLNKVYYWY